MLNQVMAPVDYEMAVEVHEHLALHGISWYWGWSESHRESRRNGTLKVQTGSGKELETDLVVLAIGVRRTQSWQRIAGLK